MLANKFLLLHVEDPTFIYPTLNKIFFLVINYGVIQIQKITKLKKTLNFFILNFFLAFDQFICKCTFKATFT